MGVPSILTGSLADLPLHDGGVIASEREQVGVPSVETHFSHVTTVAYKRLKALAITKAGRVAVQLDQAIIVRCSNDFLTVCQGSV